MCSIHNFLAHKMKCERILPITKVSRGQLKRRGSSVCVGTDGPESDPNPPVPSSLP